MSTNRSNTGSSSILVPLSTIYLLTVVLRLSLVCSFSPSSFFNHHLNRKVPALPRTIISSSSSSSKHDVQVFDLLVLSMTNRKYRSNSTGSTNNHVANVTRSDFIHKVLKTSILASTAALVNVPIGVPLLANAASDQDTEGQNNNNNNIKQYNLSPDAIAQIVTNDIVQNSFLTNGKLTRSIYDEKATFTDEIDTYTLPQWIKGTAQLFVPPPLSSSSSSVSNNKKKGSRVGLVGEVIATNEKIEFHFEEDLVFNIPFQPIVFVSGKVILDRDLDSGLITSYREFWDQDVATVLKSVRFK